MGKVVGIDLGTTFSAIAFVNQHGKPDIISNREGERITPSVVLFDGDMPIVGSIAKRSAVATPLNVVQFVKRQMGEPSWKFRTETGEVYKPEEISAIIIKRLKEDAEVALGESIKDAVITVPAYFNDAQRKSTQDAGLIAGLNVLRIINEPTAAALAYGIEKIKERQNILVYDLGGGTFDVTIMRLGDGGIEVLATGGDKNLGGFDWDNVIMEYLNEEFKKLGGLDLFDNPTLEQDLRDKAEIAKKTLSSRDKTSIFLSAGGKNSSIALTLSQFENMTESLLKRTGSIMEFVLEDAGLQWKEIDKILLVGGSTRMKAVPALIEKVTGKKPSLEVHPDEVVALGAALQGTLLQIQEGKSDLVERESFPLVEIRDVNSHSMGVAALNEYGQLKNSIVLRKDTHIPCKVSDIFNTVVDNQTELHVQVTEGEDIELEYVAIVGETTMKIPPYPKGAPIEVFFEYDPNGIIHVTVFDLTANKSLGEMHIERKSNLKDDEVEAMKQKLSKKPIN
jgi:molecular chaperone DnaK